MKSKPLTNGELLEFLLKDKTQFGEEDPYLGSWAEQLVTVWQDKSERAGYTFCTVSKGCNQVDILIEPIIMDKESILKVDIEGF